MNFVPPQYKNISTLVDAQLSVFPKHDQFLRKRFADADPGHMAFAEQIAESIIKIADPTIRQICEDYHWLVQAVFEEELHFRRTGSYRLSKFSDALEQVYSNAPVMRQYMNGLLASQLWWQNHTEVLRVFDQVYLPMNRPAFEHLEIGPGHGLFLSLAARSANCAKVVGWDISPSSIAATRSALTRMGAPDSIALETVDMFSAPQRQFDSIAFSEVLEHLEDPRAALGVLFGLLKPGGRIFINAPVNSPAPDHIFLFRTPEEVSAMVEAAGFRLLDSHFVPCTGASLERARKQKLTISAVVIATR